MEYPYRDVSIILPCYKAAALARRSVTTIESAFSRLPYDWEVIVVDDGGGDFDPVEWAADPRVRLVQLPSNRGKGAAVRGGMLSARSAVRIFTDVDLPYGLDLIPVMVEFLRNGFHVVLGDRTLPGARYRQSLTHMRRLASAAFTGLVGTLVTGGFFDTQCGLKGIRGDVAEALFPLLKVDRFAFDVELVYVALKHRLDIKRIPVQLESNETTSVRLLRDSAQGAVDVLSIKVNQLRGLYHSEALDNIVTGDFERMRSAARRTPNAVGVS